MLRAVYRGRVLAEAPRTVRVEGDHHFPPESVHREHLVDSPSRTLCPWKGIARYHHLATDESALPDVAWYYPHPSPLARKIRDHIACDPAVRVEGEPEGPRDGLLDRLRRLAGGRR